MSNPDERLDWNSETSQESKEFVVLKEDTVVDFTVIGFERAISTKGNNMAKLSLRCKSQDGLETIVKDSLVLLTSCEWRINKFFTCVGLRKRGERSVPKWGALLGSSGKAKLGVEKWEARDGKTYDVNVIKDYLEPESSPTQDDDEDLF